ASPRNPDSGSSMTVAAMATSQRCSDTSPRPISQASTSCTHAHCMTVSPSQTESGSQKSHNRMAAPTSTTMKVSSNANSMRGWNCDTTARVNALETRESLPAVEVDVFMSGSLPLPCLCCERLTMRYTHLAYLSHRP